MTEKPILFSGPMVRAILDGPKTQTRRVLKSVGDLDRVFQMGDGSWHVTDSQGGHMSPVTIPYAVGDRLWVREEHYRFGHWEPVEGVKTKTGRVKWRFVTDRDDVLFEAPEHCRKGRHHKDPNTPAWHKRLARFMPKALHRITLEVTAVKVERLQDISEDDAEAEGIYWSQRFEGWTSGAGADESCDYHQTRAREAFRKLWNRINGDDSWAANPWVAAYTFKRVAP